MERWTGARMRGALQPVPSSAFWSQQGWHVWCGSITRDLNDRYWLFYSRWPKSTGFDGWVTASEICCATSNSLFGPWHDKGVILQGSGRTADWDRDVVHNPVVICHQHHYYLYYMGNFGNGTYWDHRNHQRVGVAWANTPIGPWQRLDHPVLDVSPGFIAQASERLPDRDEPAVDTLMTSNPTVTKMADGRFLMLYKAVGNGLLPKGGKVICSAAIADHPLGPFRKSGRAIMVNPEHDWSVEDPCIWFQDGCYYALVKDFQGYFTRQGPSTIALFISADGLDWRPASDPFVMDRTIHWLNGKEQAVARLERPQIYLEDGRPHALSCAVLLDVDTLTTGNIQIPIETDKCKEAET